MGTKRKQARQNEPPSSTTDGVKDWANLCPHDGSLLDTRGFCTKADGFPMMRWFWHPEARQGKGGWEAQGYAPPFACPKCGSGLEWDGCCWSCGPKEGGPGNRYGVEEFDMEIRGKMRKVKGNHWIYEHGPEKAMTLEQRDLMSQRFKALALTL